MKHNSKLKKISCNTCDFLKKHFYIIIVATLLLSCLFLSLSILIGINKNNIDDEINSTQIEDSEPITITNTARNSETSPKKKDFSSGEHTIELPIIMYHAFIEDESKQNQYFISPKHLEDD